MYHLIVIGGGPAGLTAMIYALRRGLHVLLISPDLGGKTNDRLRLPWARDYPPIRGAELVDRFRRELEVLQAAHYLDTVDRVTRAEGGFAVCTNGGQEFQATAVIVASGATGQCLEVAGEKEFTMRGLCYSAFSYAPLFASRTVAVVGDGELALCSAAELAVAARHVYLIGTLGPLRDSPLGRKLANAADVTLLEGHHLVEVQGDGYVEGAVVRAAGGQEIEISVDGLFVERALQPRSEMVAGLVERDEQGRIRIDSRNRTSIPGILAAGDVTDGVAEQVVIATGEGAKAALSAYDYLLSAVESGVPVG